MSKSIRNFGKKALLYGALAVAVYLLFWWSQDPANFTSAVFFGAFIVICFHNYEYSTEKDRMWEHIWTKEGDGPANYGLRQEVYLSNIYSSLHRLGTLVIMAGAFIAYGALK